MSSDMTRIESMPPTNQPKIFISHSWEDKPLVRRLEKELQAAGAEVWVDHEGIRGGDNLPERINEALEWCNTLVLVWTKAASQSRWVKLEWTNAISLERAIIPCRVDNATLPAILAHKAYVPFRDVEAGLAQLLQALRLNKPAPSVQTQQVVELPARVIHFPLQEVVRPAPIAKPSSNEVLRLRSTPATLSATDVKAMLQKYDFYCAHHDWSEAWSRPQGKGFKNKFELLHNGQLIFDHATGLMWQQGGLSEQLNYRRAEDYIHDLNIQSFAGFDDWRLPTLEEATSLVEPRQEADGLHIASFFDRKQRWMWTADSHENSPNSAAWIVIFSLGVITTTDSSGLFFMIRAVR